ncbi:MAG: tripartite tricarboxylate transporter TctB family protein [Desulfotignum sp.]|nr:tripartite tricarboxylate transporter TctB family protein [Desulfotignum sp.]
MMLNRFSGLVVAVMGAVLVFWIIPWQTESVNAGWLKPATLPRIIAIIIFLTGAIQFVFPTGSAAFDLASSLRIGLFFLIALAGIYLMEIVGFVFVAPVLILVIMILIKERRLLWLVSGIFLLPAAIWFCVDFLLDKPLP